MIDEEDVTAQLLRLAGARPILAERTARARAVVHREWLAGRRRGVVRRGAVIAVLGVAASLVMAVWMNRPRPVAPPGNRVVAIAQRIHGQPLILRQSQHPAALQPLTASSSVYPGDLIETDGNLSRAALLAPDGSLITDRPASRLRFLAPAVIEVVAGAAYVATSDGSHGFEVRTAMGTVRDVGTQFEVRKTETSLRVRVRFRHGRVRTWREHHNGRGGDGGDGDIHRHRRSTDTGLRTRVGVDVGCCTGLCHRGTVTACVSRASRR